MNIDIYQDTTGKYRWRAWAGTQRQKNIVAAGTDPQETPWMAEQQARLIICTGWKIAAVDTWPEKVE